MNTPLRIEVTDAAAECVRLRNENAQLRDDARAVLAAELDARLDLVLYLADELRALADDQYAVARDNPNTTGRNRRRARRLKQTADELRANLCHLSASLISPTLDDEDDNR